jgi:branched-chain amino acid transport system permease protein
MNIAQQIVNGLVLGSGYACIALGWTILLGVARLVNFAHGQLYMLGAFATWYAMTRLDLPYPLAILAAIVALAVLGALMQSAMMGLVMTQNLTSLMIVTLGLGYVLQGGSALIFGGNPQTLPGCPSADDLRLIRRFEKGGSGSSGLEFKRPAADAASGGLRWLYA